MRRTKPDFSRYRDKAIVRTESSQNQYSEISVKTCVKQFFTLCISIFLTIGPFYQETVVNFSLYYFHL